MSGTNFDRIDIKTIILAAGKGTRMKSSKPKVLHEIFLKPLLGWVIEALDKISSQNIAIIGHGADEVEKYLSKDYPDTKIAIQKEQLGTGHAAAQALPYLEGFSGSVIIVCGDTPLIASKTLCEMVEFHKKNSCDLTVMTTLFDNPTGYGRILRDASDNVVAIVEQKDADDIQKQIKEVNTGVYCLNWEKIAPAFFELKNNNAQNEYYLTDIVKWAKDKNYKVSGFVALDNREIYGINSRQNLAIATKYMNERYLDNLMTQGVTIVDPASTFITPETTIEADTTIFPNTYIEGKNKIASNCKIGPLAHIRGNCEIGEGCKIGNFVELKNAKLAKKTNVCHLTYVGDANIGSDVNIGAGTIFANYNSITKEKKQSIVQDGASIGSNSVIVAPVEIKENAFVAALSCITKSVESDSLAMTRSPQREVKDWVVNQKKLNKEKMNESRN